jgi:fused signal recognition particle receptor
MIFSWFWKKIMPASKRRPGESMTGRPDDMAETESPEEGRGFFQRLRGGLAKTRRGFVSRMDTIFLGKKEIDDELLEELEEVLITSDIGVRTTMELINHVQEKVARKLLNNPQQLKETLYEEILAILRALPPPPPRIADQRPYVVMVVGVNGVGKTTTIGKIAARYKKQGRNVLLVAADTFRAAAIEQLEIWGERVQAQVIKQKTGSDPSAVAFDGLDAAQARNTDVVIIDTAGRLHTNVNLMKELEKVHRTIKEKCPGAPHEVLLVLDATTGQNAISQARTFHKAINVTGIALTKLDGTAKGGVAVGISNELKIPLQYIGVGEETEDLDTFDAKVFVDALFF